MSKIKFYETVTFAEVLIQGNFVYGSQFIKEPYGYSSQDTLSGTRVSLWGGAYKTSCQLKISDVSTTDKEALEGFMLNILKFQTNRFNILPEFNVNVGKGVGALVADAVLSVRTTAKIFKDKPPSLWDIDLPYEFFEVT